MSGLMPMNNRYDYTTVSTMNQSSLQTILPGEEISTIFVVGFPENMQEREFQNMFLFSPGFEAATLKVPSQAGIILEDGRKQIIGFVKFRTRLEALSAKAVLNGKKIDQEKGCTLKAEMAKKNLHCNKNPIKTPYEAFYSVPHNITPTRSCSVTHTNNTLLSRMGNKKALTVYPLNRQDDLVLSQLVVSASTPNLQRPHLIDQNPPCNTLYVGNLPMDTSQDELRSIFCECPGYKRLSFRTKSNGPMCFVEFEDILCAALALQEKHGNPLSNSVKGGIRLSFSKNPLGVRQTIVH